MGSSSPLVDYARQAATSAGIDPDLFVRMIQQESGFNPTIVSPAGAVGIAQIFDNVNFDKTNPYASLDYAANRIATSLKTYGNYADALADYNGGAGAVTYKATHGTYPTAETNNYVAAILGNHAAPAAGGSTSSSSTAPSGGDQTTITTPFGNVTLPSVKDFVTNIIGSGVGIVLLFGGIIWIVAENTTARSIVVGGAKKAAEAAAL